MENLQQYLDEIYNQIAAAERHLTELQHRIQYIAQAGMYPAQPSEQWQTRNNGPQATQYLYMVFRQNQDGTYQGPDGKRKVYVGCDPEKIREARRLAKNRQQFDRLTQIKTNLDHWLRSEEQSIKYQAHQAKHWPHADKQLKLIERIEE